MITASCAGAMGRFGNILWTVASTIGVARKSGQSFGFAPLVNKDHRDRFGSVEDVDIHKHFINQLPTVPYGVQFQQRSIPWGYHDVYLPTGDWDISGHMQSTKYFAHCIGEVRYYMKMENEVEHDYVAIHYRAGDYDKGTNGYHPRMTLKYYDHAIKEFDTNTKFLIFSDDILEAKELFGSSFTYSISKDYISDFKAMKTCKGFICANSSYSAMAAVLSEAKDKKIVMPRGWFGPAWGSGYKEMSQDIYPEGAIVI